MIEGKSSRILGSFLIIGGIPPMISGIIAVTSASTYLNLIGGGVLGLFSGDHLGLIQTTWNLQGGDAFVAGSARVAVALLGNLRTKAIFAAIGIGHSLFELWLLPARLVSWCHTTPQAACGTVFYIGVWFFMALHVVLIAGFSWGLFLMRQESLPSKELQPR